jgi:hypothetical protein
MKPNETMNRTIGRLHRLALVLLSVAVPVMACRTTSSREPGRSMPADDEGEPADPVDSYAQGQQPGAICLDLVDTTPATDEVSKIHLKYTDSCASGPCMAAVATSGQNPIEYPLDRRHDTLVAVVYSSTTSAVGDVVVEVSGPADKRWRLRYAVNEPDPANWGNYIETAAGEPWSLVGAGMNVGKRHLSTLRFELQVWNEAGSDWDDPVDPLVVLVPKRPKSNCSRANPFYDWP